MKFLKKLQESIKMSAQVLIKDAGVRWDRDNNLMTVRLEVIKVK